MLSYEKYAPWPGGPPRTGRLHTRPECPLRQPRAFIAKKTSVIKKTAVQKRNTFPCLAIAGLLVLTPPAGFTKPDNLQSTGSYKNRSPLKWGFFAHKEINRAAVFTLPAEMIRFYKSNLA